MYGCTAGTDEKAIIKVLAYRSCEQRQAIKLKFKSMYGRVSSFLLIVLYIAVLALIVKPYNTVWRIIIKWLA